MFALLMETGAMKTKVIIDEWGRRVYEGDLQDLLVLAPAGCYTNWTTDKSDIQISELRRHLDPRVYERAVIVTWKSGSRRARQALRDMLDELDSDVPRVLVMNIEALSTVRDAQEACREFLSQRRAMFVIDESTRIKRASSKRTEQIIGNGKRRGQRGYVEGFAHLAAARRVMTGLVSPKSPLDVYAQYKFLDWRILGFQNYYGFRSRYAIVKRVDFGNVDKRGRPILAPVVVGFRNQEELFRKTAPYSFRILKEDCLDIPPKTYRIREVKLTDEQRRIYSRLRDEAFVELEGGGTMTATRAMTNVMRRHRVLLGYVRHDDGTSHVIDELRTEALLEELEEHSGKAIVWVPYDEDVRRISARLEEEYGEGSVARFWGGNRSTRGEDERRFLSDPACRFMVSTPASGGYGNTWIAGTLVIYWANSDNLEHRVQSEDRSHRGGQTQRVTYVDLMVPDTVDEEIVWHMRHKMDMATTVMGDRRREWLV